MSKKMKIIIVVLAAALLLMILALVGVLLRNRFCDNNSATSVVPDNMISSEGAESENAHASSFYLYNGNEGDNAYFSVTNMFPGDSVTKYFCLRVAHKGELTVHYNAEIVGSSDKLAEVLKCKVVLLGTNEVLYDGLMRDMPESLDVRLESARRSTTELYYEITAYLDTSVGNEYQHKSLAANFTWWVNEAETGNLSGNRCCTYCEVANWFVFIVLPLDFVLFVAILVLLLVGKKKDSGAKGAASNAEGK